MNTQITSKVGDGGEGRLDGSAGDNSHLKEYFGRHTLEVRAGEDEISWVQYIMRLHLIPGCYFDVGMGLHLLMLDIVFGIPFAYVVTSMNKLLFTYLGYEKLFRMPSGIIGQRVLFITVNIILVLNWAWQLEFEERQKRAKLRGKIDGEISFWDGVIEYLESERGRIDMEMRREADDLVNDELEVAVDGEIELPVPEQPVHVVDDMNGPGIPDFQTGRAVILLDGSSTVHRRKGRNIARILPVESD